jgi:hypothetical protein
MSGAIVEPAIFGVKIGKEKEPYFMIFTETTLKGASVIDIERRENSRGSFERGFCQHAFETHGLGSIVAHGNFAVAVFSDTSGDRTPSIFVTHMPAALLMASQRRHDRSHKFA